MEVGAYEAKTHLPKLLARVAKGEHVTITKHGKAVAVLRPVEAPGNAQLEQAMALLAARRKSRPAGRKPITIAEILEAKREGQR